MSRKFIWYKGDWREIDLNAPLPPRKTPYFIRDIGDYRSMITGEMITSRSQHRDHLRAHGCIEVGNETPTVRPEPMPSAREDLIAALQAPAELHAEARAMARLALEEGPPVERILTP